MPTDTTTPADDFPIDGTGSDPVEDSRTRALRASHGTELAHARARADAAEQPGPSEAARTMTGLLRTALEQEAPTASESRRRALVASLDRLKPDDDPFATFKVSDGERAVLRKGLVHDDGLRDALFLANEQGIRAMRREEMMVKERAAARLDRHRSEDGSLDAQGARTDIGSGLRTTIDTLSKDTCVLSFIDWDDNRVEGMSANRVGVAQAMIDRNIARGSLSRRATIQRA